MPRTRPPAFIRYETDAEIEALLRGDDYDMSQVSNGDLPKSTMVVGGALWTVLFGLMVWQLSSTAELKTQQVQLLGQLSVVNVQYSALKDDVQDLRGEVKALNIQLRDIQNKQAQAQAMQR